MEKFFYQSSQYLSFLVPERPSLDIVVKSVYSYQNTVQVLFLRAELSTYDNSRGLQFWIDYKLVTSAGSKTQKLGTGGWFCFCFFKTSGSHTLLHALGNYGTVLPRQNQIPQKFWLANITGLFFLRSSWYMALYPDVQVGISEWFIWMFWWGSQTQDISIHLFS